MLLKYNYAHLVYLVNLGIETRHPRPPPHTVRNFLIQLQLGDQAGHISCPFDVSFHWTLKATLVSHPVAFTTKQNGNRSESRVGAAERRRTIRPMQSDGPFINYPRD